LHRLLQHCAFDEHDCPAGPQVGAHAGLELQLESAQSRKPSQSSSSALVHEVSVGSQVGGGPQSSAQLKLFSMPLQLRSPQHDAAAGVLLHSRAPAVHRESEQPTALEPAPSPQQ
jgi:hypothetical protein